MTELQAYADIITYIFPSSAPTILFWLCMSVNCGIVVFCLMYMLLEYNSVRIHKHLGNPRLSPITKHPEQAWNMGR